MAGLLIKNVPLPLHRRLKAMAAKHHRSMMREALFLLEEAVLGKNPAPEFPPAFHGRFPLTAKFVNNAKRRGRP